MFQADVKVDLRATTRAAQVLRRSLTPDDLTETRQAVKAGTQAIQATWMKYVSGTPVSYSGGTFTINRVSGQYANAVMGGMRYPMDGNILKGGVVVNLDYADKLERGFEPFDEKPGLLRSPKVKWTAGPDENHPARQSHPYIDVPFQHNEKDIPRSIKTAVQNGERPLGVIRLGKGLGEAPARLRSQTAPQDLGLAPYTHKAGIFKDMVRGTAGPEQRGAYMTFRRVSLASSPSSWVHPGVDPKPVTRAIRENIGAQLEGMVSSAFERDILRLGRMAGLI